ncbi:MAG: Gfo/Idh/MocA family oxidoreductase [Planctomycetes bacterium]|nr:Gfo/Idh/MocA family oxidoreductase [Planctomycetota bacterium]
MKRILVIGGGSIGERHVRCFLRTGRAEVSLCELRDDVRRRLASDYALAGTFTSLDEALRERFDAAVICTPAHLHVPLAMQIAEQNLGLLIEKPLSTSVDGIDELAAAVESRRLPVSVAYVHRQHPALAAIRRAIGTERFGRPVQVVVTAGQHFPFYRPAYRDIYYASRATGGGAIQDALTHMLNAAEWLVGPVTRLIADAEHCVLPGVEVEDTAHMLTRHGPVLGAFSLNQHQPANETLLTVLCERGGLRLEAHVGRWLSCTEPGAPWQVEEEFRLERDDLFVRQANAFLDQLAGMAEPACSLTEALQTLRVNLAALKSLETGAWIEP